MHCAGATSQALLNFNGSLDDSDQLAEADRELLSEPDQFLGVRIMARAHFNMSVAALRRRMDQLGLRVPRALWAMSNVAAFLRTQHPGRLIHFKLECFQSIGTICLLPHPDCGTYAFHV